MAGKELRKFLRDLWSININLNTAKGCHEICPAITQIMDSILLLPFVITISDWEQSPKRVVHVSGTRIEPEQDQ